MRQFALLDTAISSDNLGDEIIMQSVRDQLFSMTGKTYFHTVGTHVSLTRKSRRILRQAEMSIVGGTNFLSSNLLLNSSWKVTVFDLQWLHDVVMMGVGWRDYQNDPTAYSRLVYRQSLSKEFVHSCRDEYSAERLRSLGFQVVNTSCPTMWNLTPEFCNSIPRQKARNAVVALTYYRPDPTSDRTLLNEVTERYERVFFWTQQVDDRAYLDSLGSFRLEMIPPNVNAYDKVLRDEDVDFIGSRLHGGIRALQLGRRSLILAVDNRATEIGRDTGLPVLDRLDTEGTIAWIGSRATTAIRLPEAAIQKFKAQFAEF